MMLKSYRGDFQSAKRLIDSFTKNNADHLLLTVVVPSEDVELFSPLADSNISILDENAFSSDLAAEPFDGMRLGYINQQIIKLAFWEKDIYDDYLVLDSDMVFVRPFHRRDFMATEDTPFSFLVEDNDLQTDARYYEEHWRSRSAHLDRIKELVELHDSRTLTCHNHQVFSSRVLESLKTDFMLPRGYSYEDLIRISPYEFSWYNFWLQKSLVIPIVIREPAIKMLHHEGQHLEYAVRGTSLDDVARGYVGLVINSSFARIWPDISPGEPTSATLSRYVPASTLASALVGKVRVIPRLFSRSR